MYVPLHFSYVLDKCSEDADFIIGGAEGGWATKITESPTSASQCAKKVREKYPSANAATYKDSGSECYAVVDSTFIRSPKFDSTASLAYKSCRFGGK